VPDSSLGLFAYAGPGLGFELIPYFLGLLAWIMFAFGSVILSPVTALFRLFRKGKVEPQAATDTTGSECCPHADPEPLAAPAEVQNHTPT
jgi:hypothetical protein